MKTFLFQGDSITDAGRDRNNDGLGLGYPILMSAELGFKYPGEYKFINRGISGNRVVDLYARIKADILNLKPDYMSILIGVNDVWHEFGCQNGVCAEKFEKIYGMLIEEVLAELPDLKIFILEPYVVKGPATIEKWDDFSGEVKLRAEASKRIAEKYNLKFISLQDKFDKASENIDPTYWAGDGVHPTCFGHELIKNALRDSFLEEIGK